MNRAQKLSAHERRIVALQSLPPLAQEWLIGQMEAGHRAQNILGQRLFQSDIVKFLFSHHVSVTDMIKENY